MENQPLYVIPARFRKIENLHIVFWLIKDMCWAMLWRPLGIFMILPTVSVAVIITWQTRHLKAELYHNLAVLCWIVANCYWMLTELFGLPDDTRYWSAIPFGLGLVIIAIYYFVVLPAENRAKTTVTHEA